VSVLAEKVVVVVGASGVFGSTMARTLRTQGVDVRLIVRNSANVPVDIADLPTANAEISNRADLRAAFDEVTLGRPVDGIVNCAGVVAFGGLADLDVSVVDELFATNAVGTINVLTLGSLVAPDGFIASFTGVAADMTIAGMGAYCASKAAAKAAMAVAARELRSRKVRVLDIRAPHTETGLVDRALAGTAPALPAGLAPQAVVDRVLVALTTGERDLGADAFA
jgi:cyclic-di-GMP-binding biofilm dispersal mediator protein